MVSSLSSLFVFSITISLLATFAEPYSSPSPSPVDNLIKSLCARTNYPQLCVSTIQSELPVKEPLRPSTVLKLAMRAVRSKSEDAKSIAKSLYRNATNKAVISPLKDCVELYDDVEYSIDKANEAIKVHDKGTIGSMLSSVGTDVETCNDGFYELKLPNLMKQYDDLLAKLAEICLAIADAASLM